MTDPRNGAESAFPGGTSEDALLGGRVRLIQPRRGYRAATDPVLLAAAVPARPGERVLDLGCGVGAAALCLAARVPDVDLHGLEIQPAYLALAIENAERNGAAFTPHEGDVALPPRALRALSFDHVMTNPPWFEEGAATPAADAGRDLAHRGGTLAPWFGCALARLRPGGRLAAIQRTERLTEMLACLDGRAGDITLRPVAAREGRPAKRVLLTARKGARGPLRLLAPLVMHAGAAHDGDQDDFTNRATAILRDAAALES